MDIRAKFQLKFSWGFPEISWEWDARPKKRDASSHHWLHTGFNQHFWAHFFFFFFLLNLISVQQQRETLCRNKSVGVACLPQTWFMSLHETDNKCGVHTETTVWTDFKVTDKLLWMFLIYGTENVKEVFYGVWKLRSSALLLRVWQFDTTHFAFYLSAAYEAQRADDQLN